MIAEAILAMTLNLYMEARGEGERGMRLVADTTMTRVLDPRWPDNVKDVVLQRKQFSWTSKNRVRNVSDMIRLQDRILYGNTSEENLKAYYKAYEIAEEVVSHGYKPRYQFTHFHNKSVKPRWGKRRALVYKNHIYYRK